MVSGGLGQQHQSGQVGIHQLHNPFGRSTEKTLAIGEQTRVVVENVEPRERVNQGGALIGRADVELVSLTLTEKSQNAQRSYC